DFPGRRALPACPCDGSMPLLLFRHVLRRLRRLLTVLRDILRRELLPQTRVADEALTFRAVVFVAPVPLVLKGLGHLGAAHTALFFLHPVLVAPPPVA